MISIIVERLLAKFIILMMVGVNKLKRVILNMHSEKMRFIRISIIEEL
jgi:hypothetical protein